MKRKTPAWKIAAEIESRQDEVLRQLDELNARLEHALAELGAEVCEPPAVDDAISPSCGEGAARAA